MNRYMHAVVIAVAATFLAGCGTQSRAEKEKWATLCATEQKGVNQLYFKALDLTLNECSAFSWSVDQGVCGRVSNSNWDEAMHAISMSNDRIRKEGNKFSLRRVPNRAEVEVIGECLFRQNPDVKLNVAEIAPDGKVLVYSRREFKLTDHGDAKDTYTVSGGDPAAQVAFDRLVAERVSPKVVRQLAERAEASKRNREALNRPYREKEEKSRREIAKLDSARSGARIECSSDEVVPVNWPVDRTVFSCSGAIVTGKKLKEMNWKIVDSSRVAAQAGDYNERDYDMQNWNGRGVSILITAQKK